MKEFNVGDVVRFTGQAACREAKKHRCGPGTEYLQCDAIMTIIEKRMYTGEYIYRMDLCHYHDDDHWELSASVLELFENKPPQRVGGEFKSVEVDL